jgi:hypothetical protein
MSYDIAHRFNQALDPSACTTLTASLHVLNAAITDCRNAGKPHEHDPAVLLLARHLGEIAGSRIPSVMQLRRSCMDEIAELRRRPALIAIAAKGIYHDEPAKKQFHADGRRAMYDVRSNLGGPAVSGEITLHGDELYVQLSLGCMGPGREVMFRRCEGRTDYRGGANHWASVHELVNPGRFAERLVRELHLTVPATPADRLFA